MEFLRRVSGEIGHLYTSYFEILLYKQKNIIKAIYAYFDLTKKRSNYFKVLNVHTKQFFNASLEWKKSSHGNSMTAKQ